jgi:hypothetical protein
MNKRVTILACWMVTMCAVPAWSDDLDRAAPYRDEINDFIDVLSMSGVPPSQACVSALDEMHTTDGQLKQLTGQLEQGGEAAQSMVGQQSEVGIARDVLASDLQLAAEGCRPDAERACASAAAAKLLKACEVARRAIEGERPARH